MCRLPPRRGFTLIELLVVLAIIAVLLGLIIPAVQKARHAVLRLSCSHNMRQLGLALHNYHDTLGKFPQAYNEYWILCPPADAPEPPDPRPRQSWAALVLPFLEEQNLQATGARNFQRARVTSFLCPSDPRAGETSAGGHYDFLGNCFGLTSYLAVEGSAYEYGNPNTFVDLGLGGPKDGVIFRSSDTRLVDITDGTSNTLLLGERPPSPAPALDWGWWAWSVYDTALAVVDRRALAYPDCPVPAVYGPGRHDNDCDTHHFWSFHTNGSNWLFADGSVRFLPYAAAPLLPDLATRNGGEVIPGDF
jgi:prepilin-type N-terminal cleavage/methylation domain-containing protein/prepilin-type processing-associated H-X9-DG protein